MKKGSTGKRRPDKKLSMQGKGTQRATQLKTIFDYLQTTVATASMVTDATTVPQKCLTRYKRDLEKANRLWEVRKDTCKKTGFKAWYITTNPAFKPNSVTQPTLF